MGSLCYLAEELPEFVTVAASNFGFCAIVLGYQGLLRELCSHQSV
jgi:hypothetical protein